jgi:hypothetical protein
MSPNAGGKGEGCGVTANENSCAHHVDGAQINYGDLSPSLTYAKNVYYMQITKWTTIHVAVEFQENLV